MNTQQKAHIVALGPSGPVGLDALNHDLERGWRVAHVSPLGGAATESRSTDRPHLAALVVVEQAPPSAPPALALEAEEEVEELIEDLVEGDGAPEV